MREEDRIQGKKCGHGTVYSRYSKKHKKRSNDMQGVRSCVVVNNMQQYTLHGIAQYRDVYLVRDFWGGRVVFGGTQCVVRRSLRRYQYFSGDQKRLILFERCALVVVCTVQYWQCTQSGSRAASALGVERIILLKRRGKKKVLVWYGFFRWKRKEKVGRRKGKFNNQRCFAVV